MMNIFFISMVGVVVAVIGLNDGTLGNMFVGVFIVAALWLICRLVAFVFLAAVRAIRNPDEYI